MLYGATCLSTSAKSPRRKFAGKSRDYDVSRPRELRMIAKLLLQNLIWIVAMGALLLVPAGTLHWPAAWLFLGTIGVLGVAGGLWLARTDPELLAERMRPVMQNDQPAADKKFVLAFGVAAPATNPIAAAPPTMRCMRPLPGQRRISATSSRSRRSLFV